jgi:hypothetical protein
MNSKNLEFNRIDYYNNQKRMIEKSYAGQLIF